MTRQQDGQALRTQQCDKSHTHKVERTIYTEFQNGQSVVMGRLVVTLGAVTGRGHEGLGGLVMPLIWVPGTRVCPVHQSLMS